MSYNYIENDFNTDTDRQPANHHITLPQNNDKAIILYQRLLSTKGTEDDLVVNGTLTVNGLITNTALTDHLIEIETTATTDYVNLTERIKARTLPASNDVHARQEVKALRSDFGEVSTDLNGRIQTLETGELVSGIAYSLGPLGGG